MDIQEFSSAISKVAEKIKEQKELATTEEATKSAFIVPFIRDVLGYDTNNLTEVVPEYTTDVGMKKGEKVDYALLVNGRIQILIEAKKISEQLNVHNASQLFRYFTVSDAKIGILTNGEEWQFYTDIEKPNLMDDKPFMSLDMANLDVSVYPSLKRICKDKFNVDNLVESAKKLKYLSQFKSIISDEMDSPSDDLTTVFGHRITDSLINKNRRDEFRPLIQQAFQSIVNEKVQNKLNNAINNVQGAQNDDSASRDVITDINVVDDDDDNGIFTTDMEWEVFHIVQSICCEIVPASRICIRDKKMYCNILLDDNNRRCIAKIVSTSKEHRLLYPNIDNYDQSWNSWPYIAFEKPEELYKNKELIQSVCMWRQVEVEEQ